MYDLRIVRGRVGSAGRVSKLPVPSSATQPPLPPERTTPAMKAAVEAVKDQFKQCRGCGNWVCEPVCWNTDVGQCLNCSPSVAEEVSRGHLVAVPPARHKDETDRLLDALATMVGTLTGMVGNIREASTQIDVGSSEIRRGNEDLSMRTEQQAAQLQEFLQDEYLRGRLVYGLHKSREALVTCIVQSYNGQHLHFVDGSDGGYALAARDLKHRLARVTA